MPEKSNNPFNFWQELKRRKVFRVIVMYAGAAYIIIELVNNVAEPLHLPEWFATLVILMLIIGFPIVAILSWIFDVTPEGLKKTESSKDAKETTPSESVRRKLKLSDGIIAVLVLVVCILLYPKIFNKDKFEDIKDEDGRISVAVMPFENLSGDTLFNVWQVGFQDLLITTLSNSKELSVRQFQTMYAAYGNNINVSYASITPSAARELALKLETRTFIIGKILKAGDKIRINAKLMDSETEAIFKTYQVEGKTEDDIFAMADSLSGLIKNYLEIEKLIEQINLPDFRGSFITNSAEAFQYYIHGYNAYLVSNYDASREWWSKSIEADSGFITPYVFLAFMSNYNQGKKLCNLAYKKRDGLPLKGKLMVDFLNAIYYETPKETIKYLKQILEIEELNPVYWYLLGCEYYSIDQYKDAAVYFEKALDICKKWETNFMNPELYELLGDSYHKVDEHKKEKEVYELGLDLFPDDVDIIQHQAICALSQGETDEADVYIKKYKSSRNNRDLWSESRILSGVGIIYSEANLFDEAETSYRQALKLDPQNPELINVLAWFLINNDINVDEGLELIQEALEFRPDIYYLQHTKAWGLYKEGKYEESLELLEKSWDLKPYYVHEHYLNIQEVEQALARQESEQ
jgi:tetratricopeptide (TPR) repeat protein